MRSPTICTIRPDGFWTSKSALCKALIVLGVIALIAVVVVAIVLTVRKSPSDAPSGKYATIVLVRVFSPRAFDRCDHTQSAHFRESERDDS